MNTRTFSINVAGIAPSRWQPRQAFDANELHELARSILDQGLINPVLVFPQNGGYELIAGERRTRAVMALSLAALFCPSKLIERCASIAETGLQGITAEERAALAGEPGATIRATVYPAGDLTALHLLAVTENLARSDLSPIEEAYAYKGLLDAYGWSQRDLAQRVNKSQGYIAQRLSLLNLNTTAINALNTQVISLTHARAIAAVPEKLQEAATTWAVHAVVQDDSPATTRQVANRMRAIAAFVDPDRWQPNGERIYSPEERNRMAVIRMLLSKPDAAELIAQRLPKLMEFRSNSYETRNLITSKPLTIVTSESLYAGIIHALEKTVTGAWDAYAASEGKTCDHCEFNHLRPETNAEKLRPYCPNWSKDTGRTTCEKYIGDSDPQIMPADDYYVRNELRDAGMLVSEPFSHTTSIQAYVDAYNAAAIKLIEHAQERAAAKIDGPRLAVQEFWEWQQALPQEYSQYSNAQRCVECRYFEPLNGDAPCRFALNPITDNWSGSRAPHHGILASAVLTLLPRCEMFTWRDLEAHKIHRVPGFNVGQGKHSRRAFIDWMSSAFGGYSTGYGTRSVTIWRGPLAWLGCDTKYDRKRILDSLYAQWDDIGDGGMATLFNALLCEIKACYTYRGGPITLVDVYDGSAGTWMPISFKERDKEQRNWPDGWPKPWEKTNG